MKQWQEITLHWYDEAWHTAAGTIVPQPGLEGWELVGVTQGLPREEPQSVMVAGRMHPMGVAVKPVTLGFFRREVA